MSNWNAEHYLKYGNERTRPAADLVARIQLKAPGTIADLGCGPGNSTQLLYDRWPDADVTGIDSSPEMLQTARKNYPEHKWLVGDISQWTPDQPFDLLFSNAALQWLANHSQLVCRLFEFVSPHGALAFQVPSSTYATVRTLMHEVSREPEWNDRMSAPRAALTMESPSHYYDALSGVAGSLDIWETEYSHVMNSTGAIVDWIASTGLRPFLDALDNDDERNDFCSRLRKGVDAAYAIRSDGKILLPFRRTFVIAYRGA
ncbi:MAG: trans-aconitate 2-methyltransferase [Gammaproteobacteria bacterium]